MLPLLCRFFFIYNPSLLAQGPALSVLTTALSGIIGVWALASGFEGYLTWAGNIPNLFTRVIVMISGLLLMMPEMYTDIFGLLLLVILLVFTRKKNAGLKFTAA
ncbi:MAG: hypothetical protein ACOX1J_06010 [Dethiobacteria bacterium]